MKFAKEQLVEMMKGHPNGLTEVSDTHIRNSRWSEYRQLIFTYQDRYYAAEYSVGLTELQYEKPFDYTDDEIECPEVASFEVITSEWQAI